MPAGSGTTWLIWPSADRSTDEGNESPPTWRLLLIFAVCMMSVIRVS